jgi:ubiquitin carboxyl-terminal hydrolase 5/13
MADFGFSLNAVKRALVAVQNASVDAAVAWLFEHSGDADINDPLPDPSASAAAAASAAAGPSAEEAANLAAMLGFTEQQALAALTATGGSMERAADWLFSHAGDMDAAVAGVLGGGGGGGGAPAKEMELGDGEGKYELVGFLSHVGKNLGSGHYVAHIRKGGRWVYFNDQQVAASKTTPLDLGYMYLYRRLDGMEMD